MKSSPKITMPKTQAPCKKCPDRKIEVVDGKPKTCHSTCEKYNAFAKERIRISREIRETVAKERKAEEFIIKGCIKQKRGKLPER